MQDIDYDAVDEAIMIAKKNDWYYNLSTKAYIKPPQLPNIKCSNIYYRLTVDDGDEKLFGKVLSYFQKRAALCFMVIGDADSNENSCSQQQIEKLIADSRKQLPINKIVENIRNNTSSRYYNVSTNTTIDQKNCRNMITDHKYRIVAEDSDVIYFENILEALRK